MEDISINTPIWEWGKPSGTNIGEAISGRYVWGTDLDSTFAPRTNSWVYSPCFYISLLDKPMISLRIFSDTEKDIDGTVLQISGETLQDWHTIGTDSTGINWYHSSNVLANPGNQPINSQFAWTGETKTWQHAAHRLDQSKLGEFVRFRVIFKSTDYRNPLKNYEGFAFDDVFIGNRTRKVLLENFTSTFSDVTPIESLLDTTSKDVIAINYHSIPQDSLFLKNPAAPTARSLYYGKARVSESIFGGTDFRGLTENLTSRTVDTSALRSAKFEIIIDTTSNTAISILSKDDIDDEIVFQVAIIEQNVTDISSNKVYNHVLRKFLPSPGGISFWGVKEGEIFSVPIDILRWRENTFPKPNIVNDYSNLEVVVFVQNQRTKEVYQVEKIKIWQDLLDPDLVEREGEINNQSEVFVYPNPAKRELFVVGDAGELQILDMQGRRVYQQKLYGDNKLDTIDISAFAEGVYYIILIKGHTILLRKKIIIIP